MEENIIWKDRGRIFGLPLLFEWYRMTEKRIYVAKGLFTREEDETLMYRVLDISVRQNLFQRMLNLGDVKMASADIDSPSFTFRSVKNPKQVRTLISERVEQSRKNLNIQGRELYGVEGAALEPHL